MIKLRLHLTAFGIIWVSLLQWTCCWICIHWLQVIQHSSYNWWRVFELFSHIKLRAELPCMAAVSSNDTRHPTPRAVAKAAGRFFKWCEDVFFCMTFVFTGLHDVSRPPRTARILPFGCVIDATGWRDSLSNLHDWAMAQCTESHSGFREKKTCKKQTCIVIQWKLAGAVRIWINLIICNCMKRRLVYIYSYISEELKEFSSTSMVPRWAIARPMSQQVFNHPNPLIKRDLTKYIVEGVVAVAVKVEST